MSWRIEPQTESRGRFQALVKCKHVRFYPKGETEDGRQTFGRLPFTLLRILVVSHSGYVLQLSLTTKPGEGIGLARYAIDHMTLPPAPCRKPAKERYDNAREFLTRLVQLDSPEFAEEVAQAFATKFWQTV